MKTSILTLFISTVVFITGCGNSDNLQRELPSATAEEKPLAILVEGSGTYSRKISTQSEQAQAFFDQGLRFAWGFYFPESIASYQQAALHDPDHPMPYWGMAHAMGPNPNSRYGQMPDDPKGEGLKAIKKAMGLIEKAEPLEAELIKALFILYDRDSIPDDSKRDNAYLAAMRQLNKQHPDDPDVAALYAAAYMSIGRWDYWDSEGVPKNETQAVANALAHIIADDQSHPGVLHLHIHLMEASMEPESALVSADALEATMPIAGHVVHMPAHIYVRVGQFEKAISSNVRSQEVDKKLAKIWGDLPLPDLGTYPLSHRIHAGHAIDFIRYAATIQGNYATANEAGLRSQKRAIAMGGHSGRGEKTIAAPWLVNKIFGKWDTFIDKQPVKAGTPYLDAMWLYGLGSAYIAKGDIDAATAELEKLRAIANSADSINYRAGATPAAAVIKLCLLGLTGELLQAKGDLDGAIDAFTQAVALEDLNNYTEPPDWAQPMRSYLGAALLEAGRGDEAEKVYRRDLRWNQNNGWSLLGLSQALAMQGKEQEAAAVKQQFDLAWKYADVSLTRSRM